jgi:murein DD-endopeptidase MepM/ murein hydrolase activator NlpD
MRVGMFCAAVLLASTGCATVDNVKTKASQLAQAAQEHARIVFDRQQHYLAEHDVLKGFEDASEHSEAEVLRVLHGARAQPATSGDAGRAHPAVPVPPPLVASAPRHGNGAYHWPVEAGVISSEYGARWGKMHKGIDIAAEVGEPIYAVADGEVIYAGDGLRGYGNVIIVQHVDRVSSLYAHSSELKVKQGDHVAQGTLIALMGSTGHSTGPHVHFELRQGDVAVNPHSLLPTTTLADAGSTAAAPKLTSLTAKR